MQREPECEVTELPVSMCAHCRQVPDLPSVALHWFSAKYEGECADCGRAIEVGDRIAATDDGYMCRRCAE